MSKCYCLVVLVFFSLVSKAQIKPNSILLGGQVSYNNSKNDHSSYNLKDKSAIIGVSVGKAFKVNKVIGINLSYSPLKQSNIYNGSDTATIKVNAYAAGIFFRQYKQLGKELYFFTEIQGAFAGYKRTDQYGPGMGSTVITQRGGSISLTPGIAYQLCKKLQVELTVPNMLSVQYAVTKANSQAPQTNNSTQKQFLLNSNLSNPANLGFLGVGFRFIL